MKKFSVITKSNGVRAAVPNREAYTELQFMERNDCVVRAISASFELPYDEAHTFVRGLFQRESKKGTHTFRIIMKMRELAENFEIPITELGMRMPEGHPGCHFGGKYMVWPWRDKGVLKFAKYTVGKFIKENPTGKFFILIEGHAMALVDGVVHGNREDSEKLRCRVTQAWKIGD